MSTPPVKPTAPPKQVTNKVVRAPDFIVKDEKFQSAMPNIPGVAKPESAGRQNGLPTKFIVPIVVGGLLLIGVIAYWALHGSGRQSADAVADQVTPSPDAAQTPSTTPPDLPPTPSRAAGSNEIGTLDEFAQPWAAKKFTYSHLLTRDGAAAIAIRLPVGDGRSAASYWGILLKAPYGKCELEFVTDVNEIAAKYRYAATHPMVVDPCSGAVYDPLRTGSLPNGSWARGEIVQGTGFRPPLLIELRIEDGRLIAGRAEE